MSTNYLDTMTMYYPCTFDIRNLFTTHWIWDNRNADSNFHCFCIKTAYTFVRFFPDMFGCRRLFVTFSLPKLYHQCNDNTFNVTDYDNGRFMSILNKELGTVMDISRLPTSIKDWQPSRPDFFRTRSINPADRLEYLYGYSRRSYRGSRAKNYKNTNYLTANKDIRKAGIIERDYDKTVEQQDKKSLLYGNLPAVIEDEQEWLMHELDIQDDQFRNEFSLRRSSIVRYIEKYNLPLNMETVMNQQFQERILNDLIISRGLHHHILSKNEYRRIVKKIFPTTHTQDLALKLAESIRNKKTAPMSDSQRYRIKHELNSFFIDTATTNFVSIKGWKLL